MVLCLAGMSAETKLAETEEEIAACRAVLSALRPALAGEGREAFLARVRRLARGGYRLARVAEGGEPVCVAGFRSGESLAWGRYLYVDDLVTAPAHRSRGHGAALLAWLAERARAEGCEALHLDSGVRRTGAHRFYEREGLALSSYHFRLELGG